MKLALKITTVAMLLISCGSSIPESSNATQELPTIFPDYSDITIPSNIAPMNFRILEQGEKFLTVFTSGNTRITVKGDMAVIKRKDWQKLKSYFD